MGERRGGRDWCLFVALLSITSRHSETCFWVVYLTDNITLISQDEVPGSTVSKSEADKVTTP